MFSIRSDEEQLVMHMDLVCGPQRMGRAASQKREELYQTKFMLTQRKTASVKQTLSLWGFACEKSPITVLVSSVETKSML